MRVSAAGGTPSAVTVAPAAGEGNYAFPTLLAGWPALPLSPGVLEGGGPRNLRGRPGCQTRSAKHPATDGGRLPTRFTCLLRIPAPGTSSFFAKVRSWPSHSTLGRLQLAGDPVPVADQVASIQGLGYYSASENGVLAYRTGAMRRGIGSRSSPGSIVRESLHSRRLNQSRSGTVKLSPDGKRAAWSYVRMRRATTPTFGSWIFRREPATGLRSIPRPTAIRCGLRTGAKSHGNPTGEASGESTGRRRTDREMTS